MSETIIHETTTELDGQWSMSTQQLKELASASPLPLIEGLLPSRAVITFAGAPGIGKSFTALSWAASIANGDDWYGQKVHGGPVVYVLGEGAGRFGDRVAGWEGVHGAINDRLRFVDGGSKSIDLADAASTDALIDELRMLCPSLLILDTFSMLCQVKSENDNAEVARAYRQAHRIVSEVGCSVMFVHHVSKGAGAVRGATAFRGNADAVVVAAPHEGGEKGFFVSTQSEHDGKQRDGEPVKLTGFSIASPGVLVRAEAAATRDAFRAQTIASPFPPSVLSTKENNA